MDIFSTSSLALTAFTVAASISSAPLRHTQVGRYTELGVCVFVCVPGGQQLCVCVYLEASSSVFCRSRTTYRK